MGTKIYLGLLYASLILTIFQYLRLGISDRKRSVFHILLCACVFICDAGYAIIVTASEVELALLGAKLSYFGGCFVPVLVIRIIAVAGELPIKRIHYLILGSLSTIMFGIVWIGNYGDLYYRNVTLEVHNGISVLNQEYGPLHKIYIFYFFLYLLIDAFIVIWALSRKNRATKKVLLLYAGIWTFPHLTYLLEKFFTDDFSMVPISLSISLTLFLSMYGIFNLYNVDERTIAVYNDHDENAYVAIDNKFRITALNKKAKLLFPELNNIKADVMVEELGDTVFYNTIYSPLFIKNLSLADGVRAGDKYVAARYKSLSGIGSRHKQLGWLIEIEDITEAEEYREMLTNYSENLQVESERQTMRLEEFRQSLVTGMAEVIESRDLSTGGHIRRTSDVVRIFVRKLILDGYAGDRDRFRLTVSAAPLHDIGKIAVSDAVLRKQGKYTPEEYNEMKKHAAVGGILVEKVLNGIDDEKLLEVCKNVAHYHHEKWDGTGYPEKLKGEEIPFEARIMALADVFDALVSKRVYKEAYSYDDAFQIIADSIGSHFDPVLGHVFMACRRELVALYDGYLTEASASDVQEVEAWR